jgi:hypothetical protein
LRALGTAVGNQKIDAAIALMVAIRRAMSEEDPITGGDGFLSRPLSAKAP